MQQILDGQDQMMFGVTTELMAKGPLADLTALVSYAQEKNALLKLLGRVSFMFPEYDKDSREVFEVPECRDWLVGLQQEITFLPLLVDPQMTFKILMLCEIPWTKSPDGAQVLPDENAAMGWMLDCGMMSFEFASWIGVDDPKKFAGWFLSTIGLGDIVNDELLEDYAKMLAQEQG